MDSRLLVQYGHVWGLACASVVVGLVLLYIDRHYLSLVGAGMILVALVLAEQTHATIVRRSVGSE